MGGQNFILKKIMKIIIKNIQYTLNKETRYAENF